MKVFAFSILKLVMRGYGQMFLANNITSGMIFSIALLILSPANATWSLLGAVASTLLAKLAGMKAEMESGLFGINSTNLVNPQKPITPDLKRIPTSVFFDRLPINMPNPLVIEHNQRPYPI